jgi:hypothetical protein
MTGEAFSINAFTDHFDRRLASQFLTDLSHLKSYGICGANEGYSGGRRVGKKNCATIVVRLTTMLPDNCAAERSPYVRNNIAFVRSPGGATPAMNAKGVIGIARESFTRNDEIRANVALMSASCNCF